jgi:hypothetical protein
MTVNLTKILPVFHTTAKDQFDLHLALCVGDVHLARHWANKISADIDLIKSFINTSIQQGD